MLVFWKERLTLLATPKTGSTAMAAALESLAVVSLQRPAALKHTPVAAYHRHIRPYLEETAGQPFTSVALIRHPRDWLGSWYRDGQRDHLDDHPDDLATSTRGKSFDEFVRAWCEDDRPAYAAVGSQAEFLAPGADGKWVDRLFRYEEIGGFIEFLEDRLGCEVILPRLRVSPPGALDLAPATEALLRRKAARDFALYESLTPERSAA
jgi:hypothetical protein